MDILKLMLLLINRTDSMVYLSLNLHVEWPTGHSLHRFIPTSAETRDYNDYMCKYEGGASHPSRALLMTRNLKLRANKPPTHALLRG